MRRRMLTCNAKGTRAQLARALDAVPIRDGGGGREPCRGGGASGRRAVDGAGVGLL